MAACGTFLLIQLRHCGERLALAVNAANFGLFAIGQQIVMNPQANLRGNLELRQTKETFQCVGHAAIRGILEGDDAMLRVAAVHILENRRDAAHQSVFHRLAEPFDRRQMTIAELRPEA